MEGLQSPLFGTTVSFQRVQGAFVQILNVDRSHWMTVSNIGCEEGVANVYDIMYNTLSLNDSGCSTYCHTVLMVMYIHTYCHTILRVLYILSYVRTYHTVIL